MKYKTFCLPINWLLWKSEIICFFFLFEIRFDSVRWIQKEREKKKMKCCLVVWQFLVQQKKKAVFNCYMFLVVGAKFSIILKWSPPIPMPTIITTKNRTAFSVYLFLYRKMVFNSMSEKLNDNVLVGKF